MAQVHRFARSRGLSVRTTDAGLRIDDYDRTGVRFMLSPRNGAVVVTRTGERVDFNGATLQALHFFDEQMRGSLGGYDASVNETESPIAEGIWNPYYAEFLSLDDPTEEMNRLRKMYAYAIPNREAVDIIRAIGKSVVEVGSGSGYWAAVLERAGVRVAATDNGNWKPFSRTWTRIARIDAAKAAAAAGRQGAALLMVWPPYKDEMAGNALRAYRKNGGTTLVYVGEDRFGATGDASFFNQLPDDPDFDISIPHYDGIHDGLQVYLFRS